MIDPSVTQNYIQLLEKTNQQLSLWSNPYGVMVGILTLLVAIGAIIVAIILWKNSKEQKDLTKEFFNGLKKRYDEEIEQAKERNVEIKKEFEDLIKEQKEKLELTDAKGRKKIEETITDLEKQKAGIGGFSIPTIIPVSGFTGPSNFSTSDLSSNKPFVFSNPNNIESLPTFKMTLCSNCKKKFYYQSRNEGLGLATFGRYQFGGGTDLPICPYCGIMNFSK